MELPEAAAAPTESAPEHASPASADPAHASSAPSAPRAAGPGTSRRSFLGAAAAGAAIVASLKERPAFAGNDKDKAPVNLAASPPAGFVPFAAPGLVVKVTKPNSLKPNKLYPQDEAAKEMLTRALTELTGAKDLTSAVMRFVHKDDKVVVKVNGIAVGPRFATNAELVVPFVKAMVDGGVDPKNITMLEQWQGYYAATRITADKLPDGVKIHTHANGNATMKERLIPGTGTTTRFADALVNATACINFALVKDHGICGYTGALKNMTHGTSVNPQDFHGHHASPQIALMFAQDVIKSRVRLNIADAFKVMAHGGPLGKHPEYHYPYDSVFASTDPVAIDAIGWDVVEEFRAANKLKTLTDEGRGPAYIDAAASLGLGVSDRKKIQLKAITLA